MKKQENPEGTIIQHLDMIYTRLANIESNVKVLQDDVNRLENGLFSERKRNSNILKRIRQLKEDPEVQEIMEALQYYKNPEKQAELPQRLDNWWQNLSTGQKIPREMLLNRQRVLNNREQ